MLPRNQAIRFGFSPDLGDVRAGPLQIGRDSTHYNSVNFYYGNLCVLVLYLVWQERSESYG
jgi:hypothetical protein